MEIIHTIAAITLFRLAFDSKVVLFFTVCGDYENWLMFKLWIMFWNVGLSYLLKTKHWEWLFFSLFQSFSSLLMLWENFFLSNYIGICRIQSLTFFLDVFQCSHGLVWLLRHTFYHDFFDLLWHFCFLTI